MLLNAEYALLGLNILSVGKCDITTAKFITYFIQRFRKNKLMCLFQRY
jgi:hypothetical protein